MFLGILCFLLGIFIIYITKKGQSLNNKLTYFLGGIFSIAGIGIFVGKITDNDTILGITASLLIAILFIGCFIYNVYNVIFSNTSITGKFVDSNRYSGRRCAAMYAPVFTYTYNNKKYKNQSYQGMSKRKLDKKYTLGEEYKIFVNSTNPNIVTISKKITFSDISMLFFGIASLILFFDTLMKCF